LRFGRWCDFRVRNQGAELVSEREVANRRCDAAGGWRFEGGLRKLCGVKSRFCEVTEIAVGEEGRLS
jgi:hypothetical protein